MTVPPQLDALSGRTDLVTVGIGANNRGLYARMATVCRRSTQICRLHDQRGLLGDIVDQVRPALVPALRLVRQRAPRARVLLVGYPQLLPPRGGCDLLPRMRGQDRATFRDISLRLRYGMRDAAKEAGVEFVDFYAVSAGHDICSPNPWVQGRVGNRRGAGMHPLATGQAALARTIEEVLRREPRTTSPST
jgi:lysophospholipase L1-like esterase